MGRLSGVFDSLADSLAASRQMGLTGFLYRLGSEASQKSGLHRLRFRQTVSLADLARSLDATVLPWLPAMLDKGDWEGFSDKLLSHMRERLQPVFFFRWSDREKARSFLNSRCPSLKEKLMARADLFREHIFDILGSGPVYLGHPVQWHRDPGTGESWPLEHWSRLDIRSDRMVGDVKLTWEFNRHQHFVTLGRAYWFTGNEAYAEEFCNQLLSWIEANPPEMGVNWLSNLEIAVRSISWLFAYQMFLSSPALTPSVNWKFLAALLAQARHLHKDFSYTKHCMPNNHLVGDAAALAFIALVLPEFKEAKAWLHSGLEVLISEVERQILPDGVNVEQTVSYQRFTLYFYLLVARLAELNGRRLPAIVWERIEKCFEALLHLATPGGTIPPIGDYDDGRAVVLNSREPSDFRHCFSTAAVLLGRSDFKAACGDFDEETFWLAGEEAWGIFQGLPICQGPLASVYLPHGGYFVMKGCNDDSSHYALLECGPMGIERGAATVHSHSDVLSVLLYLGETPILVDSGTFTYNGPLEWKNYFRGTLAHNTLTVDGRPHAIPLGRWRWKQIPQGRCLRWHSGNTLDIAEGESDAYLEIGVRHRRRVTYVRGGYWLLEDELLGTGVHTSSRLFHFPPGALVSLDDAGRCWAEVGKEQLLLFPWHGNRLSGAVVQGALTPIQGWFSKSYGHKVEAPVLEYSCTQVLPWRDSMALFPRTTLGSLGEKSLTESIRWTALSPMGVGLELRFGAETHQLISRSLGDVGPIHVDNLTSDANLLWLRRDGRGGRVLQAAFMDGSYIALNGKLLVSLAARVPYHEMTLVD